jgi:hypothetical protein
MRRSTWVGAPTPSVTLRTYLLAIYRTNIGRENASSSAGCGFERGVRTLPLLHAPSNNMLRFSKSSVSVLQNTWGMTFTYTQRTCSTAAKAQRHNGAPCDKPKGTHCSPHSGHTPPIQRILICGLTYPNFSAAAKSLTIGTSKNSRNGFCCNLQFFSFFLLKSLGSLGRRHDPMLVRSGPALDRHRDSARA